VTLSGCEITWTVRFDQYSCSLVSGCCYKIAGWVVCIFDVVLIAFLWHLRLLWRQRQPASPKHHFITLPIAHPTQGISPSVLRPKAPQHIQTTHDARFATMAEKEEDFSQLPLPDRFTHKNWKVRKEGYEDAAKQFDLAQSENDPVVRQFILDPNLWKSAVADSNVAAQQEALGSLVSFLNIAGIQGCTR
jgi:XMAP215/Dis1/CLASP, TOG domain